MLSARLSRYPDRANPKEFRDPDSGATEPAAPCHEGSEAAPNRMENDVKTKILPRLALATVCAVGAAAAAQAEVVAEPELAAFCTGEAAAKLGTRPRNILTLPVERSGGNYIVYGQSPAEGADVTTFECTFGPDRRYNGIRITSRPARRGSADDGGAPPAAMARYREMVGVSATVEVVSPLRPGFTEIILREDASGRRIACTASDAGEITDWVELN
jgi:hypothetical protein